MTAGLYESNSITGPSKCKRKGNVHCSNLRHRSIGADQLMPLLFQVFTGLVFFAAARIHVIGLLAMLVLFFFFLLSIGLTAPNAAALGLAPFSRDAGSASALLGFLQAGAGSLLSTGIGVLGASAIVTLMMGNGLRCPGYPDRGQSTHRRNHRDLRERSCISPSLIQTPRYSRTVRTPA
jgi:hypothetical protein